MSCPPDIQPHHSDDFWKWKSTANNHERIDKFLEEYINLCIKYNCSIISEGEEVEVIASNSWPSDPWGIIRTTIRRGVK